MFFGSRLLLLGFKTEMFCKSNKNIYSAKQKNVVYISLRSRATGIFNLSRYFATVLLARL